MVKQPTAEQNEFTMSSEDFPALPGTSGGNSNSGGSGGAVGSGLGSAVSESSSNATTAPPPPTPVVPPPPPSDISIDKSRQGVQTSPDGDYCLSSLELIFNYAVVFNVRSFFFCR